MAWLQVNPRTLKANDYNEAVTTLTETIGGSSLTLEPQFPVSRNSAPA
jgi:hypothetical protein